MWHIMTHDIDDMDYKMTWKCQAILCCFLLCVFLRMITSSTSIWLKYEEYSMLLDLELLS